MFLKADKEILEELFLAEHSCPKVSFGLKNYQKSDYNSALIPYFGYLKMEK